MEEATRHIILPGHLDAGICQKEELLGSQFKWYNIASHPDCCHYTHTHTPSVCRVAQRARHSGWNGSNATASWRTCVWTVLLSGALVAKMSLKSTQKYSYIKHTFSVYSYWENLVHAARRIGKRACREQKLILPSQLWFQASETSFALFLAKLSHWTNSIIFTYAKVLPIWLKEDCRVSARVCVCFGD